MRGQARSLTWAVEFDVPLDVLCRGAKWEAESSVHLEGPRVGDKGWE